MFGWFEIKVKGDLRRQKVHCGPVIESILKAKCQLQTSNMYTCFRWESLTNLHLSRMCELHPLVGKCYKDGSELLRLWL